MDGVSEYSNVPLPSVTESANLAKLEQNLSWVFYYPSQGKHLILVLHRTTDIFLPNNTQVFSKNKLVSASAVEPCCFKVKVVE